MLVELNIYLLEKSIVHFEVNFVECQHNFHSNHDWFPSNFVNLASAFQVQIDGFIITNLADIVDFPWFSMPASDLNGFERSWSCEHLP